MLMLEPPTLKHLELIGQFMTLRRRCVVHLGCREPELGKFRGGGGHFWRAFHCMKVVSSFQDFWSDLLLWLGVWCMKCFGQIFWPLPTPLQPPNMKLDIQDSGSEVGARVCTAMIFIVNILFGQIFIIERSYKFGIVKSKSSNTCSDCWGKQWNCRTLHVLCVLSWNVFQSFCTRVSGP